MTPEDKLAWQRANRAKRRAAGVCVHCGAPRATDSVCERHRRDTNAASRAYYETPKGLMTKAAQERRKRQRRRAEQGFQSTGAGLAAFAAYYTNRGGVHG